MKTKITLKKTVTLLLIALVYACGDVSNQNKENSNENSISVEIIPDSAEIGINDIMTKFKSLAKDSVNFLSESYFKPMDKGLLPFVIQDNATVNFKLIKDDAILDFEIIIGGEKIRNIIKGKISGVDVFSSGEILTRVTIKQGVGNYKLELTDLQYEDETKKRVISPKPSENVNTDGITNVRKVLIFNEKGA